MKGRRAIFKEKLKQTHLKKGNKRLNRKKEIDGNEIVLVENKKSPVNK